MRKRGQAATEFILTYGWAILSVAVLIGGLTYAGILNTELLIPESCKIPGLKCNDFLFNQYTGTATLSLTNMKGEDIYLRQITIQSQDVSCSIQRTEFPFSFSSGAIEGLIFRDQGTLSLSVPCTRMAPNREKERMDVTIIHTKANSAFEHNINGVIVARTNNRPFPTYDDCVLANSNNICGWMDIIFAPKQGFLGFASICSMHEIECNTEDINPIPGNIIPCDAAINSEENYRALSQIAGLTYLKNPAGSISANNISVLASYLDSNTYGVDGICLIDAGIYATLLGVITGSRNIEEFLGTFIGEAAVGEDEGYVSTTTTTSGATTTTTLPACSDTVDNDNDGSADEEDAGCIDMNFQYNPDDNSEKVEEGINAGFADEQCDDGIDNDYDGRIDFNLDGDVSDINCQWPGDLQQECNLMMLAEMSGRFTCLNDGSEGSGFDKAYDEPGHSAYTYPEEHDNECENEIFTCHLTGDAAHDGTCMQNVAGDPTGGSECNWCELNASNAYRSFSSFNYDDDSDYTLPANYPKPLPTRVGNAFDFSGGRHIDCYTDSVDGWGMWSGDGSFGFTYVIAATVSQQQDVDLLRAHRVKFWDQPDLTLMELQLDSAGTLQSTYHYQDSDGSGSTHEVTAAAALAAGEHVIVLTTSYSGDDGNVLATELYDNSVEVGADDGIALPDFEVYYPDSLIRIGTDNAGRSLAGAIHEVRVYPSLLDADGITAVTAELESRYGLSLTLPVVPCSWTCRQYDGDKAGCQSSQDETGSNCIYAGSICYGGTDHSQYDGNQDGCTSTCSDECWAEGSTKCADSGYEECRP